MQTKLQKWGNSQGIMLSKRVLDLSQLSVGDEVEIVVRKGQITLKPVSNIRGRYQLKDLVKKIPKKYKPRESDWGPPVGNEEW